MVDTIRSCLFSSVFEAMTRELDTRSVAELRAELEAAQARLREDLQGQLWNYYGALRDPASALKERVDQLEEKMEDLTRGSGKTPEVSTLDSQATSALFLRMDRELERASSAAELRQSQLEQLLKTRLASLEATQSGAARQVEVDRVDAGLQAVQQEHAQDALAVRTRLERMEGAQSGLSRQLEELHRQHALVREQLALQAQREELLLKDCQADLRKDFVSKVTELQSLVARSAEEASSLKEELEGVRGTQKAQRESLEKHVEQTSSLQHQAASLDSNIRGLQDRMDPLEADMRLEKVEREKGLNEVKRKWTQIEEARVAQEAQLEELEKKASTTSTAVAEVAETLKSFKAQLQEVSGKVSECEKEEVAARSERGSLAEQLNRESELGKERLQLQEKSTKDQVDEVKTRIQQHVNAQLQQMQHDLQSFLRQQDTALQEQVQQQLESQEEALEKLQSTLLSRIERSQTETFRRTEKNEQRAEQIEATLRSFQEVQASAQSAAGKRMLDLEKRLTSIAVDLRSFKIEEHGKEEGPSTLKSVENKLSADLQAVKQGIDSIRNSVNAVNGHGQSWSPMGSPPVPLWPTKSQPCSPISEPRTAAGPLLRPMCSRVASPAPPPWAPVRVASRSVSPCRSMSSVPTAPVPAPVPVPAAFLAPAPSSSTESGSSEESHKPTAAPAILKVTCPVTPGLPAISGDYCLVPGECPNGRPLWKQKQQELWLYCGTNNRWFVGGPDAKGWKFQCEAGFIYSEPIANASTPDQASGWARFQGGVFLADPSVSVTA